MKKIIFLALFATVLFAKSSQKEREQKALDAQLKKEQKYAKEQMFYMGNEYDLGGVEVDPETVKNTPAIEPEYDFDMDDVYD